MKKNTFSVIIICIAAWSCNTKKQDESVVVKDTPVAVFKADTASAIADTHYFWASDVGGPKGLVMIKKRALPVDSLTAPRLLEILNELYPEVPLRLMRESQDTIFINIPNSKFLTDQMGSSGAEGYLAELVYNLTELNGINFVHLQFKQGNHASPGTYSRTDFVHE